MAKYPYFNGTSRQPLNTIHQLPHFNPGELTNPRDYRVGEELAAAVNVALTLGMPLLLTGEPGCGKSELARRIAWEIGAATIDPEKEQHLADDLKTRLLKYMVKSTTEASDLFYSFDTLGHFHAAQTNPKNQKPDPTHYIHYQALGLALLRARGRDDIPRGLCDKATLAGLPEKPQRSVVLIDEIDKAPRDVPNDILSEIETMAFTIPELQGRTLGLDQDQQAFRPIVIITSNSERDLPPAFLRRCVYFHLPFPPFAAERREQPDSATGETPPVTVEAIVEGRLGQRFGDWPRVTADTLAFCRSLRELTPPLVKPPGLAEVLNCLTCLQQRLGEAEPRPADTPLKQLQQPGLATMITTTLLKSDSDQARARDLLMQWYQRDDSTNTDGTRAR